MFTTGIPSPRGLVHVTWLPNFLPKVRCMPCVSVCVCVACCKCTCGHAWRVQITRLQSSPIRGQICIASNRKSGVCYPFVVTLRWCVRIKYLWTCKLYMYACDMCSSSVSWIKLFRSFLCGCSCVCMYVNSTHGFAFVRSTYTHISFIGTFMHITFWYTFQ